MSIPLPPLVRAVAVRLGQIALTFVLFAALNTVAVEFEIENGVSILFPATAVGILACMFFGEWAAIGIVLAVIATPWSPAYGIRVLVISGLLCAIEGLMPRLLFRFRRDLHADLRDLRSLAAFLVFGTVVNTAASAILGNLLVIAHPPGVWLNWHEVFVWWIADFTAALLLATPILAFGGMFVRRLRGDESDDRRTIANALQIVVIVILLGWAAAFAIRMYLLHSLAEQRLAWEAVRKILFVASLVDFCVLLILALASATLLFNVSRPFKQLRAQIERMREGMRFDAARVDSGYLEFRTLAETLEETATTLQRRAEELRVQTEKAMTASKHKTDFLAKMSHELRTPLNSIIGFSDLLIEQDQTISPTKRVTFLKNVAGSARHLLSLINDLLDISKVEAGKMPMNLEEMDLRAAITNSVASTTPLFARRRQQVDVELPAEPMIVRGDQGRLEQVLLNLLSNANKFSPDGDRISITTRHSGGDYRIEIGDHGIGISAEDQKRIFEEFEQVHAKGVLASGTGLGLALARRFVEAHGGAIEVRSAVGEGSIFSVVLPQAPA
jgi:signal transduction histidine kinase